MVEPETTVTTMSKKRSMSVTYLVKIAILSALSIILMRIAFPIPFLPPFLKIDPSDLPAIIGVLALGPLAGVWIALIKNLVDGVLFGTTFGVGQIANFLISVSYVVPLGIVYKYNKTTKGYITGAILGSVLLVIVGAVANYFFLIPFYATLYGAPVQSFIDASAAINPFINDYMTLILFGICPFNILKAILMSLLGYILFKAVRPILLK